MIESPSAMGNALKRAKTLLKTIKKHSRLYLSYPYQKMEQIKDPVAGGITIKETIDGIAIEKPAVKRTSKPQAAARQKADPYIWGIYIMLLMISVVELFSASSSEVSGANVYMPLIRHGIFLVLGLGLVMALQNTHYGYFSRFAWFLALISLGLLIFSNFFGMEINGAQRAINIVGFTIQPAEIVKLTVVVLLATILGRHQQPRGVSNRGMIEAAVVVVVFGACLWTNGLTNTILLFGVSISMFLIGGMKWKKFGIILLVYGICGGALFMMKYKGDGESEFDKVSKTEQVAEVESGRASTHKGRITRYLEGVDPSDPIDDFNRQVIFAYLFHNCGRHRTRGRRGLAPALSPAPRQGGWYSLLLFTCLPRIPHHGMRRAHSLPGIGPYGDCHWHIPCQRTAFAIDFQGWHIRAGDVGCNWYNAFRQSFRSD